MANIKKNYQVGYTLLDITYHDLKQILQEFENLTGMKPTVLLEILHGKIESSKLLDIMSMTTEQAYKELINKRGIADQLQLNGNTLRNYRKWANDHPEDPSQWKVSIRKMEELLELGGYKVVQEKLWKL